MKPKVFIYPGDSYHAAIEMFTRRGFEVVKDFEGIDLVCFLGGTDVDPAVYGEERGPFTQHPDRQRDDIEVAGYTRFLELPKVGICRGGQLLNVLNGGKMIQHLGKTVSGDVDVVVHRGDDIDMGYDYMKMRVDHHQGIEFDVKADRLAYLESNEVGYAGYYQETKSLCFQPHPEWGHKGTEDYFFELVNDHLGLRGSDV